MNDKEQPIPSSIRTMSTSILGITLFAVIAASVIAITQVSTEAKIQANIKEAQSRALFEIFPASIDPKLYEHRLALNEGELNFDQPVEGYQVITDNTAAGVIIPVRSKEGYSGDIDLLIGINSDGVIAGVRVVKHSETPGLGDKIDLAKSKWILDFNGKVRTGRNDPDWAVKKDGGQFDQFTGATITPRAVIAATHTALNYFDQHRDQLLKTTGIQPNE